MNRILLLLLSIVFISCSGDSDSGSSGGSNELRLKELKEEGNGIFQLHFLYLGDTSDCDRVIDVINNENYYDFFYDANNVMTTRFAINREYSYEYLEGKITAEIEKIGSNIQMKKAFHYNTNNLLYKVEYFTYNNGQYTLSQSETYEYDANQNLTRSESYYLGAPSNPYSYTLYTCDNKKNPFRNFNQKQAILQFSTYSSNILTAKQYSYETGELLGEIRNTYEYNTAGYPILKINSTSYDTNIYTTHYTYY